MNNIGFDDKMSGENPTMKVELTADEAQRVINSQRREIATLKGRLARAWTQTHYMDSKYYPGAYLTPAMVDGALDHLKHLLHLADCGNPNYSYDEVQELIKLYEDVVKDKDWNKHSGIKVSVFDFMFLYAVTNYDERSARAFSERMTELRKFLLKEGETPPPNHWFSGPGNKEWMP